MKASRLPLKTVPRQQPAAEAWALERLRCMGAYPDVEQICSAHGESIENAIFSDFRYPKTVRARHGVWTILHFTYGMSFSEIARMLGVHRSSVRDAVRNYVQRKEHDDEDITSTGTFVRGTHGYERRPAKPSALT